MIRGALVQCIHIVPVRIFHCLKFFLELQSQLIVNLDVFCRGIVTQHNSNRNNRGCHQNYRNSHSYQNFKERLARDGASLWIANTFLFQGEINILWLTNFAWLILRYNPSYRNKQFSLSRKNQYPKNYKLTHCRLKKNADFRYFLMNNRHSDT